MFAAWDCNVFHIDQHDTESLGSKYPNILTAEDLPESMPLILLAPFDGSPHAGTISLESFEHPASATYMFGYDEKPIDHESLGLRVPDYKVYIPTKGDIHAHICASIVMYDRAYKKSS